MLGDKFIRCDIFIINGRFRKLPKSSIDNKDVASDEFVTKQDVELRSKNQNPSTELMDRDVPLSNRDEEEEVKELTSTKSLEEMLLSAQSETNPIKLNRICFRLCRQ